MSLITAAPMFGNIMALIWSDLAMGRRKVPLVNALQAGVVLMIGSVALVALLPPAAAGWVFAGQIIVARLLASGIITIRSSIWRANYPRQLRGQLTSRIATVATLVLTVTTFAGSYLLDQNARAYVYIYPVAALIGVIGIWQFSKIRVRREVLLRRQEVQLYAPRPENMMLATMIVQIIPMVVMMLATQAWAPMFDRMHISTFRTYQGFVSVGAIGTLWAGAMIGRSDVMTGLGVVAFAQVLVGVSNGAGNLAWNLGHNDFCPADKAGTYMGVHVMLTGLRGCLAPFFGSWLYLLPGVGRHVFGLSTLVCIAATLGFLHMARNAPRKGQRSSSLSGR
ncbi:MAG TPA: hypothetical protein VGR35_02995 [Tepidisphaeraceae bacterium]|nr:hypothetical protein [Tepidisphaeraceae bacterium]